MGQPFANNPFEAPSSESIPPPDLGRPEMMVNADRGKRFIGQLVDNLLFVVVCMPGIIALVSLGEDSVAGWILIVLPALGLWIYQMFLVATTGQSIAKKWLKTKIVKIDGSPVDFVSGVLLRSWAIAAMGLIPFVGSFVGLVDALMIFGEEHQCLHDKIASTRVIDIGGFGM